MEVGLMGMVGILLLEMGTGLVVVGMGGSLVGRRIEGNSE
jgi:hypothetical protein